MRRRFYLPKDEAELVTWLKNFSSKIKNEYAAVFNISSADVDKITGFAEFYSFLKDYIENVRSFSEALTSYKNNFKNAPLTAALSAVPVLNVSIPATIPSQSGLRITITKMVNTIKAHAKYSRNIGEDLGIEGVARHFIADEYTPKGKAKSLPGIVQLKFAKNGIEAMNIYGSVIGTDADEWVLLATQSKSPFHDSRKPAQAGRPEKRRYFFMGVIADKEIGKRSQILTATFEE